MREFIDAIVSNWQLIKDHCQDESWLPTGVNEDEYLGFGSFGCVFSTNDDEVVFKVTTDVSEYTFVDYLIENENRFDGIVKYFGLLEIKSSDPSLRMFAMWREAAHGIGLPFDGATSLKWTGESVYTLSRNADKALAFLMIDYPKIQEITSYKKCSQTEALASELFYYREKIFNLKRGEIRNSLFELFGNHWVLCDVRTQNIGFVKRNGKQVQVIIDPGLAIDFSV